MRIDLCTKVLLDIFDYYQIKSTFFALGWIAERRKSLVQEIQKRGHEIASHGYTHRLLFGLSKEDLKEEAPRKQEFARGHYGCSDQGVQGSQFLDYGRPSGASRRSRLRIRFQLQRHRLQQPLRQDGRLAIRGERRACEREHSRAADKEPESSVP